eukprot:1513914-Pyramimonas_sp.AAC.1
MPNVGEVVFIKGSCFLRNRDQRQDPSVSTNKAPPWASGGGGSTGQDLRKVLARTKGRGRHQSCWHRGSRCWCWQFSRGRR